MFADELPFRRTQADSLRAEHGNLQPADRHAQLLGVVGSVERPLGAAGGLRTSTANARQGASAPKQTPFARVLGRGRGGGTTPPGRSFRRAPPPPGRAGPPPA